MRRTRLRRRGRWKNGRGKGEHIAGYGRGQFQILLDYVRAVGGDALSEKKRAGASRATPPISVRQPDMRPKTADRSDPCRSMTAL